MHEKITDMEDDISSIKNDVKELKEIQTQEGKNNICEEYEDFIFFTLIDNMRKTTR